MYERHRSCQDQKLSAVHVVAVRRRKTSRIPLHNSCSLGVRSSPWFESNFTYQLCFAQKILTTSTWSAISTVPRAKRPDVPVQRTNSLAANYENHIGKSYVTSGRFARGTVQTIASFCATPISVLYP